MSNETIGIDKPEQIAAFRVSCLRQALAFEVKFPGSKLGRANVFQIIKDEFGFRGNKASVLKQLEDLMEDNDLPMKSRYTSRN